MTHVSHADIFSTTTIFEKLKTRARPYLWLAPLIAGTTWILMLAVLFLYWIASGRPKLPLQSNPYVAYVYRKYLQMYTPLTHPSSFISDIGAFHLKPVFIAGCTLTSISFLATILSVHYARYSKHFYDLHDSNWRKAISVLALFFGTAACLSLFLLTIFDTYRYHVVHRRLLLSCFANLASSAVCTQVVWLDQAWKASSFVRLRRWLVLSDVIVVVEVCLGIAFTGLLYTGNRRVAGILEWIITVTGGLYLLTFMGILR